jgi:predicted Zn-dependent protease with MMP-like domain
MSTEIDDIDPKDFEDIVREVLKNLPPEVRGPSEEILFVVEDEPSDEIYEEEGLSPESDDVILSSFETVPVPIMENDSVEDEEVAPTVFLYRIPHLEIVSTLEELKEEVKNTIEREIAYYLGVDDDGEDFDDDDETEDPPSSQGGAARKR